MAITDEIISMAGDLENYPQWKSWMPELTPIGHAYVKGEPRRYYKHKRGGYYYRRCTEAEMHCYK